jgi:HEPN domain-containing protein
MELAKEWIKAAYSDIVVLDKIVNDEFITHMTAFHSQQTIEKSLKALLISNGISFKKIHSLNKLFSLSDNIDVESKFDLIQLLDSLYVESRYPGDIGLLPHGKPTLKDAKEFYDFAKDIFERICTLLDIDDEEIKK